MDLFPELPEDLTSLSDEELSDLLKEHEVAAELIESEDEDFIKGLSAEEVLTALETGVEQIEQIVAEQASRVEQQQEYTDRKAALADRRRQNMASTEVEEDTEEDSEKETEDEDAELSVEAVEVEVEDLEPDEIEVEESVLVASASEVQNRAERKLRRPPAPSANRIPSAGESTVLTAAAGLDGIRGGQPLDRLGLAEAMRTVARRLGPPARSAAGIEQRFFIAQANFPYPDERRLMPGELDVNARKIQAVIPDGITGMKGNKTLTASGGLCAPLEPFYSMPNFAVTDRPVRDALPSFQADRGGVSVPEATIIGDIDDAISTVTAEEDELLGTGTWTKSCQDLDCPEYRDATVTTISHCREYGNLNARAWPEKIAHENDLTMAALARTAESYLLNQIKAQSLNVTMAQNLGAMSDLVAAIVQARAGVRYRLRSANITYRVLMPAWVPELLASDNIKTELVTRFEAQAALSAHLQSFGINVAYYLDDVAGGTSQGFSAEADSSSLDVFPSVVQWAFYPEGAFLHLDGGTLDLGIVRDSTLNATNDFQIFGEIFENVIRIAPEQAALWVSSTVTPSGEFPALAS